MLILHHRAAPVIRNPPLCIFIPTPALWVCETTLLQHFLNFLIELLRTVYTWHYPNSTLAIPCIEYGGNKRVEIPRLRFDHQDDGVVSKVCVGAVKHSEIRDGGNGRAVECCCAAAGGPDI
jgi:hypothetical protein